MKIKAKHIFYVGAFIVLTIVGAFYLPKEETFIELKTGDELSGDFIKQVIYVHIEGAINNPGVKEVPIGTRLFELIEIADGAKEDADISRLNLSSILKDEQKIVVPYKISESEQKTTINYTSYTSSNSQVLVDINYASQSELEKLTGIGPSMAQKIIKYREENGCFNSIEDIKNVSGIGEAKYEKIKDEITV